MIAATFTTSWDDGHPLDLKVASMLERHGLPGTFYIPRENKRPVMSEAEIKDIGRRFEVGGHTLRQLDVTTLPDAEARTEIVESRAWLRDLTGQPCPCFCFPRGNFQRQHIQYAKEAGYELCRTVELLSLSPPTPLDALLVMPTTIQVKNHLASAYLRNALKRRRPAAAARVFRWRAGEGWYRAFENALAAVVQGGGILHLWGHSWEIEQDQQWEALDRALALVAAHGDQIRACSNGDLL